MMMTFSFFTENEEDYDVLFSTLDTHSTNLFANIHNFVVVVVIASTTPTVLDSTLLGVSKANL